MPQNAHTPLPHPLPSVCSPGKYEDEIFLEHIVEQINNHDPANGPLFAYIAWHNCHAPPQVPNDYLANFSFINYQPRQVYAAKVNFMVRQHTSSCCGCSRRALVPFCLPDRTR